MCVHREISVDLVHLNCSRVHLVHLSGPSVRLSGDNSSISHLSCPNVRASRDYSIISASESFQCA